MTRTGAAQNKDLLATAAINGSTLILEKWLDVKADLNKSDQYGWISLLLAQHFNHGEAASFLLQRVAQIGMKPSRWISAYDPSWIQVSNDGCSLQKPDGRHICVLANHPIPAGLSKYDYEIEISEGEGVKDPGPHPIRAIGFCTSSTHLPQYPG